MTKSTNPPPPPKPNSCLTVIKVGVALMGGLITLCGLGGGAVSFFVEWRSRQPIDVTQSLILVAFTTLWVGLGSAVAWQASRAIRQQPAALFRLPRVAVLLPFYVAVLVTGQAIIWFEMMPAFTLPPFHIIAAIMPGFFILAFASRSLQTGEEQSENKPPVEPNQPDSEDETQASNEESEKGPLTEPVEGPPEFTEIANPATTSEKESPLQWREIILQLAGGTFLATSLAFTVEILAAIILFVIFALLTPGAVEQLEDWQRLLESNPLWLQRPANIQEMLLFPPILLTGLTLFVIVAPLCEELFKVVGVLLMSYQRPTAGRIFIWGLAAGAGFALTENLFNTVLGVETWGFVMLLRIGATAMHCLGSGLIALGWQHLQAERRPGRLIGAYGLSVIIHALWNGITIGSASTSMVFLFKPDDTLWLAIGGFVAICLFLMLLTLAIIYLVAIGLISRRLAAN